MRCRAWLIALAVATPSASPRAQAPDSQAAEYAAAVHAYVVGHDAAKAVAPLAAWTPRDVHNAVRGYLKDPKPRFAAAAVFHLEIAVGLMLMGAVDLAENHLGLGYLLVRDLRPPSRNIPSLSPGETVVFMEKWYVATASTFLMVNDRVRAEPIIERGLQVSATSPELRLMSGIIDEMAALSTAIDESRSGSQISRMMMARTQALSRAKGKFEKLLADEPRFTRARIRFGRVLWLLDERARALTELLRAQSEAREPAERYLAAMFLGAIYEQSGNVTGARVAYETALAAAPASQAATVALGHLEVMAGRPDRAQALARQLLSKPPVADEWWSYKNGGFEMPALIWLRTQVWQ